MIDGLLWHRLGLHHRRLRMVLENRMDRGHARLLIAAGRLVGHWDLARSVRQNWRRVLV